MFALNVRAPFFLAQRAAHMLRLAHGNVVNIADLGRVRDVDGLRAARHHEGCRRADDARLAHVLAPEVRVNAVAPGVVMLPEGFDEAAAEHLRRTTPLGRLGTPEDVAQAVVYLLQAEYVTGEVIRVDGGRHVRR